MCAAGNDCRHDSRSVYELIVLRGDEGDVLVRGGSHFTEFRRVLFVGSIADGGSLYPRTIDIGLRMQFMCRDRLVTTSAGPVTLPASRQYSLDGVCSRPVTREVLESSEAHECSQRVVRTALVHGDSPPY
jgi:hypothetical protein